MTSPAIDQSFAEAKPVTRHAIRTVAMTAYAVVLVTWSVVLGVPNDTIQVFGWLWLATIAWNAEAPWRYHLGFLRDWWLPMAGLVIYFFSRGLTDNLGFAVHYRQPIRFDEWLTGGEIPTIALQHAWCGDPCSNAIAPRWYDVVFTTVYSSHFLAGLTIAAVLWVRNRDRWVQWMRRYLLINYGALVVYILYPMAPPWMAAEHGLIGPVARISSRGWADIGLDRVNVVLQGVGNPVAAMPSLHAGITFLIAGYFIQTLHSRWRWLLLGYPAAMCVTLVYTGEHYVLDVLCGGLLAGLVLAGSTWWENRRVARSTG